MPDDAPIIKFLRLKGLPAQSTRGTTLPGSQTTPFAELSGDHLGKAKHRRPRGIAGPQWSAKDERMFKHIRESCLEKKPRCTTKYTKGKRVRQCYRDCERIAAATVNKHRKSEGRDKKQPRKKKSA